MKFYNNRKNICPKCGEFKFHKASFCIDCTRIELIKYEKKSRRDIGKY